jgi:hypothetical protein
MPEHPISRAYISLSQRAHTNPDDVARGNVTIHLDDTTIEKLRAFNPTWKGREADI